MPFGKAAPATCCRGMLGNQNGVAAHRSLLAVIDWFCRCEPFFDNPQHDRAQSANPALPGTCAPFLLAGTGNGNGTSPVGQRGSRRSEEHTSELQSLMRISYDVFCL